MEYTTLGRTGLSVSRVGFGGGGIGEVWGPTTRDEAVRAVHRALDLGINFFDVAPAYGNGKAEEALGLALEGRSEDVIIATKVRLSAEDMGDVKAAVQRSMETSLRLLKRDSVDVLHVHNRFTPGRGDVPNSLSADDVLGPVLDAYQAMQQAGKTRFIGLSAMDHDVPTLDRIMASGHWDTVLAYYNLLTWTAQEPAPPAVDLESETRKARVRPPASRPMTPGTPKISPTATGRTIASSDGKIISFWALLVEISTQRV